MTGPVCTCGLTTTQKVVNGVEYWACAQCDAHGRCRQCGHAVAVDELFRVSPDQIGLIHVDCPLDPEAIGVTNATGGIEYVRDLEAQVERMGKDLERVRASGLSWMDASAELVERHQQTLGELEAAQAAHQTAKDELNMLGMKTAEEARLRGALEVQLEHVQGEVGQLETQRDRWAERCEEAEVEAAIAVRKLRDAETRTDLLERVLGAARRYREGHLRMTHVSGDLVRQEWLDEVWAARDAFDEMLAKLDRAEGDSGG